jgi:putative endonuclease
VARADPRTLGSDAERLAAAYLERQGASLIERNFRCRLGEIDIIAADGECLAFVEVRYRGSGSFSNAGPTVDRRKQSKLIRAASLYAACRASAPNQVMRFDVVAIDTDESGNCSIEWIKDAFRPGDSRL